MTKNQNQGCPKIGHRVFKTGDGIGIGKIACYPAYFFRINRQQVVNLHFIEKIETWFSHGLKIWLKGGEECEVLRRAARAFRQKLSL